jgi:uncharacterized protein (DUF2235 family)
MGKMIIFCADGTWNGPVDVNALDAEAKDDTRTNVYRLFANLNASAPADPDSIDQERDLLTADGQPAGIAKYLHGVGNSTNPIIKVLGGAFGAGLIARIVRGYTFISRNYQPGDDIVIIGFSRGAYTARALAGLIAGKGVMRLTDAQWADKTQAYRLGVGTWYKYQAAKPAAKTSGWFSYLACKVVDLAEDVAALISKAPTNNLPVDNILAVGVWDTVGAMGIPLAHDGRTDDVFAFADTDLSSEVLNGFHAVSLDERRIPFTPTLWTPDSDRIKQVLFPGAHSDVGGGYNEKGLSDNALAWMMNNLEKPMNNPREAGVVFADPLPYPPQPNPADDAHEPWLGSVLYKINAARVFTKDEQLGEDDSIAARMKAGPVKPDPTLPAVAYAPTNLP